MEVNIKEIMFRVISVNWIWFIIKKPGFFHKELAIKYRKKSCKKFLDNCIYEYKLKVIIFIASGHSYSIAAILYLVVLTLLSVSTFYFGSHREVRTFPI